MIDNKPRDYGYLEYKDRYPLQLTGTMKKRRTNIMKENMRESNYSMNTITFGNNEVDREKFLHQVMDNYQDLKSVLPVDLEPSRRTCSKKIPHPDRYIGISGAPYLMIKSNTKADHPERRHIEEKVTETERRAESGKKHFQNKLGKESQKQWKGARPHTATLQHKLDQDLYSNVNRRERAFSSTVRMSKKTMFSEGSKLGYDQEKGRRISCSKHQQLMGQYCQPLLNNQKNLRDDWRRSSIVLG